MVEHLRTQLQNLAREAGLISQALGKADPDSLAALDLARAVVECDRLAAKLEKVREAVAKGRRPDAA
jgi:hypothetical protein